MTTYVYNCPTCQEFFDKDYPMGKAEAYTACPLCGNESKKILTPPAGFQIN